MWRVSLLFVGACSFAFMSAPSAVPPPDCDARYEAPVTDTVIAGAALGLTAAIAAFSLGVQGGSNLAPLLLPLVPMTVLYGSSAAYGYVSRSRCEDARGPRRSLAARSAAVEIQSRR